MSNLSTPTADQLAAARRTHWHQDANPILTINMLRDWLHASGVVLYAPRAAQMQTPAPSLVEATLGAVNAAPTLAESAESRSLLARLIADGAAVPLYLLGNPTGAGSETPDFIVSTAAFPYIFTMRGDKVWKQPPTVSGTGKVSPLASAAYKLLAEKVSLTAYDLATQLGKEVTEAAVLRALTELWQHLRVVPIPQPDGAPARWELTTTRFTKQIKTGANAGQPTALSALISLYLGQAIVASEEEIEIFLSPLSARSRTRDVIHALVSARQLETMVIEGRTVMHVAGEAPSFAVPTLAAEAVAEAIGDTDDSSAEGAEVPRITKFIPKPRKVGTGFAARPERGADEHKRRPFKRDTGDFAKPWDEEKRGRKRDDRREDKREEDVRRPKSYYAMKREQEAAPGSEASSAPREGSSRKERDFSREGKRPFRESKPSFERKPSFGRKPSFERKPSFGRKPFGDKPRGDADRPAFRREREDSRPSGGFSKPRRFDRDREESRPSGGFSKPRRFDREGSQRKPFEEGSSRPRRSFDAKPRFDARSRFSDKPRFDAKPRLGDKPRDRKPRFEDAPRSGHKPRFDAKPRFSDKPRFDDKRGGPPFRKFDSPRKPRPFSSARPSRAEEGTERKNTGFKAKPFGGKSFVDRSDKPKRFDRAAGERSGGPKFAGKKPFGKPASDRAGKPFGGFDKFKGKKKPFGKPPAERKFKPERGESAE